MAPKKKNSVAIRKNTPLVDKHKIFFGLDQLELAHDHSKIQFDFEPNIDMDNSAVGYSFLSVNGELMKFSYSRIKAKGYPLGFKFETILNDEIIPCFALFYGGKAGCTNSKNKLTIYSTFFVVEQNGWFPPGTIKNTLRENFEIMLGSIRRMDISFDTTEELPKIIKRFDKNIKFHSQIGDDAKYVGYFQTYYTSGVQNSTNRTRQVRIYDKILDSFKKGKSFLFPHIKGKQEVRRIELELRPAYCERLLHHPFDILDNLDNIVWKLFEKNMAKYSLYYSNVDVSWLLPYAKRGESPLRQIFMETGQIPEDYMARVNGYMLSIHKNCGYKGMFQLFLGTNFDKARYIFTWIGSKRIVPTERDPLEVLTWFIQYLSEDLQIPAWRVWKTLEKYKTKPNFRKNTAELE